MNPAMCSIVGFFSETGSVFRKEESEFFQIITVCYHCIAKTDTLEQAFLIFINSLWTIWIVSAAYF